MTIGDMYDTGQISEVISQINVFQGTLEHMNGEDAMVPLY